ncbi:hypothetical protein M438DRAFT_382055 [Aureobasidium pullulans EXF-150]|uniref:Uncharacterized protein n=1 Tax=Aureobasidium pullulans EXF-150 TaxID=1043002 RepID=A0A074XLD7_AURPU|nr:uncharacterized protein M438DRAFT_382055 [Aureobasidium pullulans EXF-150]KEQ82827.1 hypothetical protein M438DRAFT_382055 [Aureobasidium pullulans EXF-150]
MVNPSSNSSSNPVSTTNTTLAPLIAQANVIATQARSRQDYWANFAIRSEANLSRFDIAKRLLVSDSEFALKLLELAVEVAEKVEIDREELVKEKDVQMEELKGVKEDIGMFERKLADKVNISVYEQKKALDKATATFEYHANAFASKAMGIINPQEERFDEVVARNYELEQKLEVLESQAAAVQKMKEDMEKELEG